MENSIKIKVATIALNNQEIDIEGYRDKESMIFVEKYDKSKTKMLIQKLNQDIRIIDKNLRIKGYFFYDEISYYDVPPEVIKELLNRYFEKTIECAFYVNNVSCAIYYNKECKNIHDIRFNPKDKLDNHISN